VLIAPPSPPDAEEAPASHEPTLDDGIERGRQDPALGLQPRTPTDWPRRIATATAIGVGGFLGAAGRYQLGQWAAGQWGAAFPWGTLLVNVLGSFLLGFYLALVTERFVGRPVTRLFLATGFLGAFTTFSTFSYEAVRLVAAGAPGVALAYVAGSLALGLAAAVAGMLCAHAL
jgi:CrcB protein